MGVTLMKVMEKSPSGKNGQKWHKNMVFGLLKKIEPLDFSGICVK